MRWRHWGGGYAEHIFVHFGLNPRQYFLRLQLRSKAGSPRVRTKPMRQS